MPQNLNANENNMQAATRAFIQYGGPRPENAPDYAGEAGQYMAVMGVQAPISGTVNPVYVPDPRRQGFYRLTNRSRTPPGLATSRLMLREKTDGIPRQLLKNNCALNVYEVHGNCNDLSDFLNGWTGYVNVYSGGLVDQRDLGDRTPFASDNPLEDGLNITWADIYPIGSISFGNKAAQQVVREVVDVVYGSRQQCGECGPFDDGTNLIYAVTKSSGSGSPGFPPRLVYSTDGSLNWVTVSITSMGSTEDPVAIEIVGSRLVVIGSGAYYWAAINPKTGAPGTFTKVTTGFVAAHDPTDIYVANPREVYFSGNGGYVYKTSDITAGVTVIDAASATSVNLSRINGDGGEVVVAVGASSTVIKSVNRGATFATTSASPAAAATLTASAVRNEIRIWVGSAGGQIFRTNDGGETWTEKTFSGSGVGAVDDIVFASDEVIHVAYRNASPTAYILTSWNGGADFARSDQQSPRILNWPTFNRANRIAVPRVDDSGISTNNLCIAGLAGDGTDGVIFLGIAGVQ